MSKKDYEALAKVIACEMQELRERHAVRNPSRRACMELLVTIAYGMSESFEQDNPRFDEDRFMGACGFNYIPPRDEYSLAARWGI